MEVLITGANGFVGSWLAEHLKSSGDSVVMTPSDLDIRDRHAVDQFIAAKKVDVTYHLAALTHVGQSWEDPTDFYQVNVIGTQNLCEALGKHQSGSRLVLISSSEVYGPGEESPVPAAERRFTEESPLRPVNPYAASKAAAEMVAIQAQNGRGIDVVIARPFNHVGPGQGDQFVVAGLARRIVEASLSGKDWIPVGNLGAKRDFTDVRDVVRAYRLLAVDGVPGNAYNVSSGRALSIREVAELLIEYSESRVELRPDKSLMRPVDVFATVGDHSKISKATGWCPVTPLDSTLRDTLEYWRARLA